MKSERTAIEGFNYFGDKFDLASECRCSAGLRNYFKASLSSSRTHLPMAYITPRLH